MRYTKDLKAWAEFANEFIDHQQHLVRFGKIFDWNEMLSNPIPRNELYNWISTTLIPRLTGEKSLSAYFGRLENGVSIYSWDKEMEQHGFYTYDPESFVNVFEDDNMDYLEKLKKINDNAWLFNIAIFINEMNRQLGFTNFAQIFVAYKDKLEGELEAYLQKDNTSSILYSQIWGSEETKLGNLISEAQHQQLVTKPKKIRANKQNDNINAGIFSLVVYLFIRTKLEVQICNIIFPRLMMDILHQGRKPIEQILGSYSNVSLSTELSSFLGELIDIVPISRIKRKPQSGVSPKCRTVLVGI